jgi:hypothetical protein
MEKYLDIDNCIILNDSKRIVAEPAEKKTKTKRQLAKQIHKKGLIPNATESSIYTRLWRFEKEGYVKQPDDLIDAVLKVLLVSSVDLLKQRPKKS